MSPTLTLFHAPASPFVRKVMVLLHETGQLDKVRLQAANLSPVSPDNGVNACNPAGKIPCLRLADGQALYDSRVIVEYLDQQHAGAPLIPREGPQRWQRLTLAALADAIMDAAVISRYETFVRPEEKRWDGWLQGQQQKIERALAHFEGEAFAALNERFDIVAIGLACALGYLDFRRPDWAWREQYPKLAAWYAEAAKRPSLQATQPV
ncbi:MULTISPECIES: glutathione S-transferase [Pseudomonas]|jgi:glutathione S-transferase|uniref:glutathione S-transferase n=1 Tax=Pseudomonas TaxID=286 RepID=UPI0004D854A9|nr:MULTISPECIES: glutathione S-transferase [Pseudomonas]KES23911.1 glutathione S-transferase [Pseudomonas sp. AAC]MBH3435119.1 glutathione S-transferase [Pseudomonas citronellolis]OHR78888.1 glutathione S-transferase [Pseudomonas sp. HMSC75E02]WBG64092.1 glutathione S-transferase [Pseudomonas citronellolis]